MIGRSGQKMDDRAEIEINEIIAGIMAGINVQKAPTIEVESLEELNFDTAERKDRIIQLAEALEDMKKTMTSEERNFFERLGSLEPIRGNLIFKLSCFIDTVLFPVPFVFFPLATVSRAGSCLRLSSVMSRIRSDTSVWKLALSQSCSPRIKMG